MYYIDNALVRSIESNSRWAFTNVSLMTVQDVYRNYKDVYLRIYRQGGSKFWVDAATIWSSELHIRWSQTVETWLSSVPNTFNFVALTGNPTISKKTVLYSDGWRSQYDARRIANYGSIDNEVPYGDKTDVLATREITNYDDVQKYCLFTVSGLLHHSYQETTNGIRIIDAGKTSEISDRNNFGVLSFQSLGEITQIPFTDDMILAEIGNNDFSNGFYINLNTDVRNKTLVLSIGGYLHVQDKAYSIINPEIGLIKINSRNLSLVNRLFESQDLIDLSSLNLTRHPEHGKSLKLDEVWSEPVLRKYFTLTQSFAIVVDEPGLYTEVRNLETTNLPGIYTNNQEPMFPMVLNTGIMPEYWVRFEDGIYVMSIVDNLERCYQYTTTSWLEEVWVIPNLLPFKPYRYGSGQLREIGSETIVFV